MKIESNGSNRSREGYTKYLDQVARDEEALKPIQTQIASYEEELKQLLTDVQIENKNKVSPKDLARINWLKYEFSLLYEQRNTLFERIEANWYAHQQELRKLEGASLLSERIN